VIRLPVADGIEPVPRERRRLALLDQWTLWANLGVSLVGVVTGAALVPALSFWRALAVVVVGGVIGGLLLAASAFIGAATALPAMAIMRRALGLRGSYVPTVLNVLQNTGWSAVETFTVAEGARAVVAEIGGPGPRLVYYVGAGAAGIALALFGPLSVVRRLLRLFMTPVLVVALAYLLVRLVGHADFGVSPTGGLPLLLALDIVIAYNASWLPLAPDYTRFSPRPLPAATGAALGYFAGTFLVFAVGLLVGTIGAAADPGAAVGVIVALPLGLLVAAVVVVDESEKTFANVYSTAVSLQNLAPALSQRLAVIAVGVVATAVAWTLSIDRYINFLLLLGAVFVSLFGAVIADRMRPPRPFATAVAWLGGFVLYEWIQPPTVTSVADAEHSIADAIGLGAHFPLGHGSVGASLPAFALAFCVRLVWPARR
jgi:putative hydroxymethylpyrimidine transporter CytX